MTKRQAELQSAINMGCHTEASRILQQEVLAKMNKGDPVVTLILGDPLLIELGNAHVRRNVRNPLKRGAYCSAKLRLCARVLLVLKRNKSDEGFGWSDFLVPGSYRKVVKAVLDVCGGTEESIDTPSNALKLGHQIKEMADIKYSLTLMNMKEHEGTEARIFKELVDSNWKTDVSCLATAVMSERSWNKPVELPIPGDLLLLSTHLQKQAREINTIDNASMYRRAVEVAEGRLLTYNKRRPGELEGIT